MTQVANAQQGRAIGGTPERTHLACDPGDAVGLDIAPASFHLFDRQGHTVAAQAGRA